MPSSTSSSSRGWRALVFVLATVAAFFLADRLLAKGLERLINAGRNRFAMVYGGRLNHAVWVFGNSRGVNGVLAPDLAARLGQPVVNLSYNGVPMIAVEALLDDALARNPAPRLVMIEVHCLVSDDGVLGDLKVFAQPGTRLFQLLEQRRPDVSSRVRLLHCWRFNSEVSLRALNGLLQSDQGWMNGRVITRQLGENYRPEGHDDDGFVVRAENWAALQRIVAGMKARGVGVLLYSAPFIKGFPVEGPNFSALLHQVQSLSGEGVAFLNLTQAIDDWRGFADPIHSNYEGWARIRGPVTEAVVGVLDGRSKPATAGVARSAAQR